MEWNELHNCWMHEYNYSSHVLVWVTNTAENSNNAKKNKKTELMRTSPQPRTAPSYNYLHTHPGYGRTQNIHTHARTGRNLSVIPSYSLVASYRNARITSPGTTTMILARMRDGTLPSTGSAPRNNAREVFKNKITSKRKKRKETSHKTSPKAKMESLFPAAEIPQFTFPSPSVCYSYIQ